MSKKNILIFTNALYGGGAEKVLQTLLCNFDYSKFNVTLYSLRRETLDNSFPSQINYHYIYNQYDERSSFINTLLIRIVNKIKLLIFYRFPPSIFYKLFVRGEYDTEIAFIEGESTRIVSGSKKSKSKKIAWVHIDLIQNHWSLDSYRSEEEEKQSYSSFNHIVCVSNNVRDSFLKLFPFVKNVSVNHNPIDAQKINSLANESRSIAFSHERATTLVTMGRLVPQKGYDRLIPIVKRLTDEGFSFSIYILGDGKMHEELKRMIFNYHLESIVHMIGYINNPYPYVKHSDLFVCSSRSEGYSTAVSEALILGTPVITTNCAGMDELLGKNNEYGIIVPNNEEALYDGLKNLLQNPNLINVYKERAIIRGKQFSLELFMSEIEKLF